MPLSGSSRLQSPRSVNPVKPRARRAWSRPLRRLTQARAADGHGTVAGRGRHDPGVAGSFRRLAARVARSARPSAAGSLVRRCRR